eukprot:CAMPEP_0203860672 /NCGR_PEP_ID=MMETSP0359-20131031/12563_1 /ASSEMBLY_ACC=CAM_ASM_000338 /TAXON_ID=268821 /ORGANISM="Scrippsiella Hangoei, Strain SHTV-5" /LENGTH=790 /DNA_ID=CAMNT_0050777781 /DNA_START=61 /DNA_END=2430 /DNA_ORIENTATION=-
MALSDLRSCSKASSSPDKEEDLVALKEADLAQLSIRIPQPYSRSGDWDPVQWVEAREAALHSGRFQEATALMQAVRSSTSEALRRQRYDASLGGQGVQLSRHCSRAEACHWFASSSVDVPEEGAGDGRACEPPIIVTAMAPLDVVSLLSADSDCEGFGGRVASIRGPAPVQAQVAVVVDVSEFDAEGVAKVDGVPAGAVAQNNAMLRSDLSRFIEAAARQLRGGNCTMKHHLTAMADPYVLVCPDVCVFRGGREEGYPFLDEPHKVHAVVTALPSQRPAMHVGRGEGVGSRPSEWYATDDDEMALLERLNLVGSAALQQVRGDSNAPVVLVLDALGCSQGGRHPHDSLANALRHWRKRFAGLYHAVVLACGPDAAGQQLASHLDTVVNKDVYAALMTKRLGSLTAWHWDETYLRLHINRQDFMRLGGLCQFPSKECDLSYGQPSADPSKPARASRMVDNLLADRRSMHAGRTVTDLHGADAEVLEAALTKRTTERHCGRAGGTRPGSAFSVRSMVSNHTAGSRHSTSHRGSRLSALLAMPGAGDGGRHRSGANRSRSSVVSVAASEEGDICPSASWIIEEDEPPDLEMVVATSSLSQRYGRRRSSAAAAALRETTPDRLRREGREQLRRPSVIDAPSARPSPTATASVVVARAAEEQGKAGGAQRSLGGQAKPDASKDEGALRDELSALADVVRLQLASRSSAWCQPPSLCHDGGAGASRLPTLIRPVASGAGPSKAVAGPVSTLALAAQVVLPGALASARTPRSGFASHRAPTLAAPPPQGGAMKRLQW